VTARAASARYEQHDVLGAVPEPVEVPGGELRTGDICAPGSFGLKSPARIRIEAGARPLDPGRVEITFRVGGGPSVTGALREDSVVTVVNRTCPPAAS
jgi:hypothetical protein